MDFACIKCFEPNDENEVNCHKCGTPLNFPLQNFPSTISDYTIISSLGRGFYGITYIAKDFLDQNIVLKVIPKELYEKHNKDFIKECRLHAEISKGTMHLVEIKDVKSEVDIPFDNIKHTCHISILNFINGKTLGNYIEDINTIKVKTVTQIALDLLKVLDVLSNKKIHHNDLHPDNIIIEELNNDTRRSGEIDNLIKVVAIDLGSISQESNSNKESNRKNDVHWIANYIQILSNKLINNPEQIEDRSFRVAIALQKYAKMLLAPTAHNRIPTYEEIIESVKNTYHEQTTTWKDKKLVLKNMGQYYNAQTLDSWNIPDLFVEEDSWLNQVSSYGPLVITGMRGCGKTMLLKSMQIHARIKQATINSNNKNDILKFIQKDSFLGLYINSNRLLDEPGISESIYEPLSKLLVSYGIEAINALKHLKEIDYNEVNDYYFKDLFEFYSEYFDELKTKEIISVNKLEEELYKLLNKLNNNKLKINTPNPVNLFPMLAKIIKQSCNSLKNQYILFLFDDISTRYLTIDNIKKLFSSLIFQDENCAFKFTSEVQTMIPLLYSPGLIEKAKEGRDIETFDLGEKVYEKTSGAAGRKFVLQILDKRKKYTNHPNHSPEELLGDISLIDIALNISGLPANKLKDEIYHGVSALTGVCVGDIGDIILLYKNILEKRKNNSDIPIPAKKQHACFLELSNQRLHDLKKRKNEIDKFALSFAEASNNLLIDSTKKVPFRLRDYNSIYIDNTTGNSEEQYKKIRELVDAGIFVLLKGSKNLRARGKGNNPINQFILLYRKILGLSKLIGLSQADRFELRGNSLTDWLNDPENGDIILKKSVEKQYGQERKIVIKEEQNLIASKKQVKNKNSNIKSLFDFDDEEIENDTLDEHNEFNEYSEAKHISQKQLIEDNIELLIASTGFEERAYESIKRCINTSNPKEVLVFKNIQEKGYSKQIIKFLEETKANYTLFNDINILQTLDAKNILVDISGMPKNLIFNISSILLKRKKNNLYCSYICK
jgi:serine/threonine protein kinase